MIIRIRYMARSTKGASNVTFRTEDGSIHRLDGPAVFFSDGEVFYYQYDEIVRDPQSNESGIMSLLKAFAISENI